MKKNWMVLPVVLLAVFGLLFLGCDDGNKGGSSGGGDVTWSTEDLITFDDSYSTGTAANGKQNVYVIDGDELATIIAATKGTKLIVSYTTPAAAPGDNRNGWGMGFIGDKDNIFKKYGLTAVSSGAAKGDTPFNSEPIEVSWALDGITDENGEVGDKLYITTGVANQDKVVKVSLYKPSKESTPAAIPQPVTKSASVEKVVLGYTFDAEDINYFGGDSPDVFQGKGDIEGDDFDLIAKAYEDYDIHALLRVYVIDCTAPSGNGVGRVGEVSGVKDSGLMFNTGGSANFYVDIYLSDILGTDWWDDSWDSININIWNGKVSRVELLTPPEAADGKLPDKELKLAVNQTYGYQSFLLNIGFDAKGVKMGEEYTLTATIQLDKPLAEGSKIEFFVADEPWSEMGDRVSVSGPLAALTDKTIELVLPVTKTSATNLSYSRVAVSWGGTPSAGQEPTVYFWDFSFTKTKEGISGPAYTETTSLFANGAWNTTLTASPTVSQEDGTGTVTLADAGYTVAITDGTRWMFRFGKDVDTTGSALLVVEYEEVNGVAETINGLVYNSPDEYTDYKYLVNDGYNVSLKGMGPTIVYPLADFAAANAQIEYNGDGAGGSFKVTELSAFSFMAYYGEIKVTKIYLANPAE